MRILLTNFACFTQRKERLHEDSILQSCSDFENEDSHMRSLQHDFDDQVKEVGGKGLAQKTCKKRGSYFGSHALGIVSFEMI